MCVDNSPKVAMKPETSMSTMPSRHLYNDRHPENNASVNSFSNKFAKYKYNMSQTCHPKFVLE